MAMAVRERQMDAVPHRPDVKVKDAWLRWRIAAHSASFCFLATYQLLALLMVNVPEYRLPLAHAGGR